MNLGINKHEFTANDIYHNKSFGNVRKSWRNLLSGVFSTPFAFFSGLAFFKRKCLSKIDLNRVDYDLQYTSHTIIVLYYIYFFVVGIGCA